MHIQNIILSLVTRNLMLFITILRLLLHNMSYMKLFSVTLQTLRDRPTNPGVVISKLRWKTFAVKGRKIRNWCLHCVNILTISIGEALNAFEWLLILILSNTVTKSSQLLYKQLKRWDYVQLEALTEIRIIVMGLRQFFYNTMFYFYVESLWLNF